MFASHFLLTIIILYILLLFSIALWVEKVKKNKPVNSLVYALSLAIYCTSWTYYGSVGSATTNGLLFLTIYIGPTIAIILWWSVARKIILIKQIKHINSIADFISARYNSSRSLAAIATTVAIVGIAPYIALQIKAIISTFRIISVPPETASTLWVYQNIGPLMVILMILFTIVFGVRRLDPTERHHGMITAVAVESMVKLFAFLVAGIFVCFFLFDGVADIFTTYKQIPHQFDITPITENKVNFTTWITYLILSMSAIIFLPRQFHVTIVENANPNHLKKAAWILPLYLFLINLFVVPIALGGYLHGISIDKADTYVIALPLLAENKFITLLVFIGGLSAATSMIMISSMTLSTMVTNHLVLPIFETHKALAFLRRYILQVRWLAVAMILLLGYWFEKQLGESYTLINMGMLSFAAALQFAPSIIGGIYWREGNKTGALLGLTSGFSIWFYTLLFPSFIKSGWINSTILDTGPLGMWFLAPEKLFGLYAIDPLSHGVFWTMFFNIGLYVIGSLASSTNHEEQKVADNFVDIFKSETTPITTSKIKADIELTTKEKIIMSLLEQYFHANQASLIYKQSILQTGLKDRSLITVLEYSDLCSNIEKKLAGSIGTGAARKAFVRTTNLLSAMEGKKLTAVYGKILSDLKLSPQELHKKIDYHQDRAKLIQNHAQTLEEKIWELEANITQRKKAQKALAKSEREYSDLVHQSPDPIITLDTGGDILFSNPAADTLIFSTSQNNSNNKLSFKTIISEQSMSVLDEELLNIRSGKPRKPFELEIKQSENHLSIMEINPMLIAKEGESSLIQLTFRNITERKKTEKKIISLQNYYENIIDAMPSTIIVVDDNKIVILWNQEACNITGIAAEAAKGKSLSNVFPIMKKLDARLTRAFVTGEIQTSQMLDKLFADEEYLEITIYPLLHAQKINGVIRVDIITERIRMEEMVIQSEKMLSLGGLAAGMAHEINNPLAGITQNLQVARNRLSADMPKNIQCAKKHGISLDHLQGYMDDRNIPIMFDAIKSSVRRAADIVDNMLSFSRGRNDTRDKVDIKEIMDGAIKLATNDYNLKSNYDFRKISITKEYDQTPLKVECERSKLQQVFFNLLSNGAQAMAESPEIQPSFHIRIDRILNEVLIEIEDNGPGIEKAVQRRVFEPFFTTKKVGLGTGLGLSVSYFIITENHGGTMQVTSTPGESTLFSIHLPINSPKL